MGALGTVFFTVLFVPFVTVGAIVTLAINEKMEKKASKKPVSVHSTHKPRYMH